MLCVANKNFQFNIYQSTLYSTRTKKLQYSIKKALIILRVKISVHLGQLFHAIEQLIAVDGVDLHDTNGISRCKEGVVQIADFRISDARVPDTGSDCVPSDGLEPYTKMMEDPRVQTVLVFLLDDAVIVCVVQLKSTCSVEVAESRHDC